MAGVTLLLSVVFYFIKTTVLDRMQKAVGLSVATITLCFFLLNSNFYPKLLTYQGGNELAAATYHPLYTNNRGDINPEDVYFWKDMQSSSYSFYTRSLRQQFADSVVQPGKKIWLLFDIHSEPDIIKSGYQFGQRYSTLDYEVTKLDLKFLNPIKRKDQCTRMVLAELLK
jgi:hypothetical protein